MNLNPSSTGIDQKVLSLVFCFSLFAYSHYYFFTFTSDSGSHAPLFLNYVAIAVCTIPILLLGAKATLRKPLTVTRLIPLAVISLILLSALLWFDEYNYLDKEFLKFGLLLFLIASFFEILKVNSTRPSVRIPSNLFIYIVAGQCLLNITLWLARHELWLGRQVGLLGNPTVMGLIILISAIWSSFCFIETSSRKWLVFSALFIFSLLLAGAKFCTLLFPVIMFMALLFNLKYYKKILVIFFLYLISLSSINISPDMFPPVMVSTSSNSYQTRIQQHANSTSALPQQKPDIEAMRHSSFGSVDNQFLDLYRGLGPIATFLFVVPILLIGLMRFWDTVKIGRSQMPDIILAVVLISLLVYRSLFYFPISLFFAFALANALHLILKKRREQLL